MVQGVSGKRRFLVRFQDGCEKDVTSNKLTILTVENIPMNKEAEVVKISVMPNETIDLDKGYYHGVYVLLYFNNDVGVDST